MCRVNKAFLGIIVLFFSLFSAVLFSSSAHAATGINQQLNFQGKVVNASGNNIADGTYNMEFKVYQDGTGTGGGTLKWTEDYLVGGSGGVTVSAGTFNVRLGANNPFASQVDWNQDTLFLSFQVGNTSSCTIVTNFQTNCSGDGEMSPYIRLTAVPYAMNANKVGGLTASQLVQLTPGSQQTGSINVSSDITSGGQVKANTLDAATSGALTVGSSNATSIALAKNTTLGSGLSLALQGTNALTLGSTTAAGGILYQDGTVNNRTVTLTTPALTNSYSLSFAVTGASGNQCLQSTGGSTTSVTALQWGSCGGAVTLQNAYDAASGNTITTTNARDLTVTLADTATDSNLLVNIAAGSTSKFAVQNNGTDLLTVSTSGVTVATGLTVGTGNGTTTPGAGSISAASGTGSSIVGGNTNISAGNGTGTGGSGAISFNTAAPSAGGSLTYNSANVSSGEVQNNNTLTYAHTIGSLTSGILMVGVGVTNDSATCQSSPSTVSGVTYNGIALTRYNTRLNSNPSQCILSEMWYLKSANLPAAGTYNVVVTATNSTTTSAIGSGAMDFSGVDQGAFGPGNTSSGTGTAVSDVISGTVTGQTIVDIVNNDGNTPTATGTGQTRRYLKNTWVNGAAGSTTPGAASSSTVSYTLSAAAPWAVVGVALSPAAGASTADTMVERLRIDQNGQIGVGQAPTSTGSILQVNGGVQATTVAAASASTLEGTIVYDSTTHKFVVYEGSGTGTKKTLCNTTDLGCGGGTVDLQTAYTGSGATNPQITLTSGNGGIKIRDGSVAVTGNLFQLQNNAGTATYLGVSSTALTLQDASGNNALVFDSTTSELRVYDNVTSPTGYASITYSGGAAIFSASTGITKIGSGTGSVTVNLTGQNDKFAYNKTYTPAGTYSNDDFTVTRTLTGAAFTVNGSVVKIEDVSTGSVSAPTVLLLNQGNASATGYLFRAQKSGVDKLSVDTSGNLIAGGTINSGVITSTSTIQGTSLNGTTGINTGASGGTQRIDSSGNLVNTGNITGTGAVTLASTTSALTLTSGSGTIILGSNTIQRVASGLTLDVNNAGTSTLTVTNSDSSNVANLSVEGSISIGAQADATAHTFGSGCACLLNSAAGTFGSQTAHDAVVSSVVFKGKLFISTRETDAAGVYRYDGGTTWTLVTNATGKAVVGDTANIDSFAMTVFNGALYIGSQGTASTAGIYSSTTADTTADSFALVNATRGSFGMSVTVVDGVSDMAVWNGNLFMSTQEPNVAEIGRYDGGSTFTQINITDGKTAAEVTADMDGAIFTIYTGRLFIGAQTGSTTARVAEYDGVGTTITNLQATLGTFGASTLNIDVTSMTVWNGELYIAASKADAAGVYRWLPDQSERTSTVVTNFDLVTNATVGKVASTDTAITDSIILRSYNGRLYAGSATTTGTLDKGALYEYDGTKGNWTVVNAALGTFGAQTAVNAVTSLQELNGTLYVGTDDGVSGVGAEYSWSKTAQNSYGLQFNSGSNNLASLSFVGNRQASDNNGHYGSFLFSHAITMGAGAFDYAEDYQTTDSTLLPGEPVAVDAANPDSVKRASAGDTILGVVSKEPGFRLSANGKTKLTDNAQWVPIALVGRVPVRVSTNGGVEPITAGDKLAVSTTPGILHKAHQGEAVVGVALSSYNTEAVGEVSMFVHPEWNSDSSITAKANDSQSPSGALTAVAPNGASAKVVAPTTIASEAPSIDMNVQGAFNVGGDAEFHGNSFFYRLVTFIEKVVFKNDVSFGRHILTEGEAPKIAPAEAAGVTVAPDDQPEAVLATTSIEGNDNTGQFKVTTGQNSTTGELLNITFSKPYDVGPHVLLTATNEAGAHMQYYVQTSKLGFKLVGSNTQLPGTKLEFNYLVVQ